MSIAAVCRMWRIAPAVRVQYEALVGRVLFEAAFHRVVAEVCS